VICRKTGVPTVQNRTIIYNYLCVAITIDIWRKWLHVYRGRNMALPFDYTLIGRMVSHHVITRFSRLRPRTGILARERRRLHYMYIGHNCTDGQRHRARQLTTEKLNVRRCIVTAIIFLVMIVSNYSSVGHRLYVGLGRPIDREITNKNVIWRSCRDSSLCLETDRPQPLAMWYSIVTLWDFFDPGSYSWGESNKRRRRIITDGDARCKHQNKFSRCQ